MITFIQLIIDGIVIGLIYVILAGGLVLMLSVPRVFFIAYGQWYMIGAYVVWGGITLVGLPFFVALLLSVFLTTLIGILTYRIIFYYLLSAHFLSNIVAAMGLMLILGQGALLTFGTTARGIPSVFPGIIRFQGLRIPIEKLVVIVIGIIIISFLFYVYEKTKIGRAMRAVSFNPEAAKLCGIIPKKIHLMTFGLSAALAGLGGGITAPAYLVYPEMGHSVFFVVLLVLMLGGIESLPGAVFGGIVLGLTLSFGQYFMKGLAQVLLFGLIAVVVFFKPEGLFGGKTMEI